MRAPGLLFLLAACSDYGLKAHKDPEGEGETGRDTGETGAPAPDSGETADTGRGDTGSVLDSGEPDTDTRPCADDPGPAAWTWWGSQPFAEEDGPSDGSGRAWYATDYEMVGWSTVSMPDSGHCPSGYDRVYRAWFDVSDVDHKFKFRLQSDDGIWLYVNGEYVGHWGGDWQEEGCVNDDAGCEVAVDVDPINITEYLHEGSNLVAARVSNAIDSHWFDLQWECED